MPYPYAELVDYRYYYPAQQPEPPPPAYEAVDYGSAGLSQFAAPGGGGGYQLAVRPDTPHRSVMEDLMAVFNSGDFSRLYGGTRG